MSLLEQWDKRSIITANLLNPAFCGEVIRRAILGYNSSDEGSSFPFSLVFLVLPFVLHKKTREKMPKKTSTYFHSWVEDNEHLFIDFSGRAKELLPYTKEAILFLDHHNAIAITENGLRAAVPRKAIISDEHGEEVNNIFKKSEFLGKWFRQTGNEQTIYMFLKIQP